MKSKNRKKYWYRFLSLNQLWVKILFVTCVAFLSCFCAVIFYYHTEAAEFDLSVMDKSVGENVLFAGNQKPMAAQSRQAYLNASLEDLPPHLIDALIAREDNHFFTHSGIDYMAIARSMIKNTLSMRYKQGGSTLTMQLARNLFELRDRTIDRKLLEVSIARRLEKEYEKEQILVAYLNRIYYGCSVYGIANAAQFYFGKEVRDLDLVESATLVGLIRGPSLFNPVASMRRAERVKNETLQDMKRMGLITPSEYERAVKAPIKLQKAEGDPPPASYPLMEIDRALEGLESQIKYRTPMMGIHSYYDADIQKYIEKAAQQALGFVEGSGRVPEEWVSMIKLTRGESAASIRKRLAAMKRLRGLPSRRAGAESGYLQCAILVVDAQRNRKGNVLALISGRDSRDGINRWHETLLPGRAANPFLFCIACQSDDNQSYVIANEPEETGKRMGYRRVADFMHKLGITDQLPPAEEEARLYTGVYPVKRITLARLFFSLLHKGMDFPFRFVQGIYSHRGSALYYPLSQNIEEMIRRESAYTVKALPPFILAERKPLSLNVTLPQGEGQWSLMSGTSDVSVFVWIGFDKPLPAIATQKQLSQRLAFVAPLLTEQIHQFASEHVRKNQRSSASK